MTTISDQENAIRQRLPSAYNPLQSYVLPRGDHKQYQQQYGDMYFLRLATLKPAVEQLAEEAWADFQVRLSKRGEKVSDVRVRQIAGEKVRHVDRVLDVRQGELCWVAGAVFMDMPLKPNILDDISKDVRVHATS